MEPAEIEANRDTEVKVQYGGNTYIFPASLEDAPGDVIDAIDDQKISHALKSLVGDDQWDTFKTTKPTFGQYGELLSAYLQAIGLETPGN